MEECSISVNTFCDKRCRDVKKVVYGNASQKVVFFKESRYYGCFFKESRYYEFAKSIVRK